VPSLFTGWSWRDHSVLNRGQALSDSFVTLAEILQAAGYRTIAYSASPNASVATGSDQGFDEFIEVWKHPDHGPGINAELPVHLLTARHREDWENRPIFLYMHLVPPHEPYTPGEEHDLWADPNYQGTVNGTYEDVMSFVRGERRWDQADLERLVSLYDANLHLADQLVDRIVRYWRNQARDREFLVLLLSDHGEAFAEHGRFTHNSTIYDEMVRIPLILYPAEIARPLGEARESLLAVTDILPMLLHVLKINPPSGSRWPRRFLQVLSDPTAPRKAVLLRSASGLRTSFGLRTDRYLALFDGWNKQELYDLTTDPQAKVNLRLSEYPVYLRLIGQLTALMADRSQVTGAQDVELTDKDLETLKSLGYL
jgi:arylsulfatase A-like enzyme